MSMKYKLLAESGVFPDETSAAYALNTLDLMRKGTPLLTNKGPVTKENFREYLEETCKVETKDTDIAIHLLLLAENFNELSRTARRIARFKEDEKKSETTHKYFVLKT